MTNSQKDNDGPSALAAQLGRMAGLDSTLSLNWDNGNLSFAGENGEIQRFIPPIKSGTVLNFIRQYQDRPSLETLPRAIELGPFSFDPRRAALITSSNGDWIQLTDKERDILAALWSAPEKSLSREDLLAAVWAYADGVETHTLETHIYRLRQKIEKDPATPALLVNLGGTYRLVA